MKKTTVTKKEILANIRTLLETSHVEFANQELTAEMAIKFCTKEIAALDRKAEKAKATAAAKKAEGDALRDVVEQVLTNDWQSIADIVVQIEGEDVTMGKVIPRLAALIDQGVAEKTLISVGEKGAKAKRTFYRLVQVEEG